MFNMCKRTTAASGGQAEVSICRWCAAPAGRDSGKIAEGTAVAIKHLQFPLGGGTGRFGPPKTREEFDRAGKACRA